MVIVIWYQCCIANGHDNGSDGISGDDGSGDDNRGDGGSKFKVVNMKWQWQCQYGKFFPL